MEGVLLVRFLITLKLKHVGQSLDLSHVTPVFGNNQEIVFKVLQQILIYPVRSLWVVWCFSSLRKVWYLVKILLIAGKTDISSDYKKHNWKKNVNNGHDARLKMATLERSCTWIQSWHFSRFIIEKGIWLKACEEVKGVEQLLYVSVTVCLLSCKSRRQLGGGRRSPPPMPH